MTPSQAIRDAMEKRGLPQIDMLDIFGTRARASEIVNGRRAVPKSMAPAEEHWTKMIGGHTASCRLIQPNFLYKPTGFKINWYKYPFRDSYMTPKISAKEWKRILTHCRETALKAHEPSRA